MYRVFDFCIECDFPLPGLPPAGGVDPAWRVSLVADDADEKGFEWFHDWKTPSGVVVMSVARRVDDYLLDCMGMARFRIDFQRRVIAARPLEGCQEHTLAHLLLDQVLPRVVCHQGRPVLHASAVILDDGRAVAFAGPSGRGKSTLASAFYRAGYQLITDDCLLLEVQANGVQAVPAYPSLRLWQDSLEALLDADDPDAERLVEMAHYTSKKQLLLSPDRSSLEGSRPPLAALFLLGEPPPGGVNDTIRITPMKGRFSLMALVEDTFALDVVGRHEVSRSFRDMGRLAAALQIYRLDYPRDYETLSRVIDKVSNFVVI